MLGRLFKSKSSLSMGGSSLGDSNDPTSGSSDGTAGPTPSTAKVAEGANPSGNVNSFEDSYTREILYGSSELALQPLPFNPRRFRLLVSQDGGDLRSKQVLYDSANDQFASPSAGPRTPPILSPTSTSSFVSADSSGSAASTQSLTASSNRRIPASANTLKDGSSMKQVPAFKLQYSINDLNDYMFGRGIPSVDKFTSTKVHLLPPLNSSATGASSGVLLTRIFSISDSFTNTSDSEVSVNKCWHPRSTFPSKESVYVVSVPSGKAQCASSESISLNRQSSFSSRFAVGVIVPLEHASETVEEVLSSNWETLTHFLIVLQKLVCKKLSLALRASLTCHLSPFINNKRIQFPAGILQLEAELGHQLQKLIKLVHYNVNTPRIVNIHALTTHSLNHVDSKLKSNVINWALEVINWLEFKDGRNFTPLHAQAIPQIHTQNSHLSHSNSSASSWYRSNETQATTSTFLASLLALIIPLRGSLCEGPLYINRESSSESKTITRIVIMTSNSSVAKKLIFILSGLIPDAELLQELEAREVNYSSTVGIEREKSYVTADPRENVIPVESNGSSLSKSPGHKSGRGGSSQTHDGGITFSAKPLTAKPIPIRNSSIVSDSQSDESLSHSVSSTKGWDVPHKSAASSSFSNHKSLTELSNVTIAQQMPIARRISATNTSSMAYLSSSLNSSLSSSASNYSLSRLGSSFMERWKNSLVGANKSQQSYFPESLDGAITSETLDARPVFASTKSPSPGDELDEPIWEDPLSPRPIHSPAKQKGSRTQSLLNLFDEAPAKKSFHSAPALGANRTRSSIIIPPVPAEGKTADEANQIIIRRKVQKLMNEKIKYSDGGFENKASSTLSVEGVCSMSNSQKTSTAICTDEHQSSCVNPDEETLHHRHLLKPNVAFVDEFRPEYTIQSCPVNPRLEAHVSNTMKNDLLFYQNNCGYEKVTTKTVYVSLRAREIKLIEMSVGNQKRGYYGKGHNSSISPAAIGEATTSYFSATAPNSPNAQHFSGADMSHPSHESRGAPAGSTFRTTVKKVYTPHRNSGDKEAISQIEGQLERLNEVASLINSDAARSSDSKDLYNRMLFNAVRELIM